jgi:hypothetical protein
MKVQHFDYEKIAIADKSKAEAKITDIYERG